MTFLFESRISDVEKKYQSWIELNPDTYDYVVSHDPSGNQKYLDWVIKTLMNTYDRNYNHYVVTIMKSLEIIHQHMDLIPVEQRDINRLVTFDQLNKIRDIVELKIKDREAIKNSIKIYEDDNFLVVKPESYEASCKYGRNSKWCISGNNLSDGPKTWLKYIGEGKEFIFVINKKANISTQHSRFNRLAIVLSTVENDKTHFNWFMEVYDALDQSMLNGYNTLNELSLILPEKVISSITKFINDKNAEASKKYYDKIATGFTKIAYEFIVKYPKIGDWVGTQYGDSIGYINGEHIIKVDFNEPRIEYHIKIKNRDNSYTTYSTYSTTEFRVYFNEPKLIIFDKDGSNYNFTEHDKIKKMLLYITYHGFVLVKSKVDRLINVVERGAEIQNSTARHTHKKGENTLINALINFIENYNGYRTRTNFFKYLVDIGWDNPTLKSRINVKGGLRGHYSSWFNSLLNSGIIETKKIRTDEGKVARVYIKGPNFNKWNEGKLVYY